MPVTYWFHLFSQCCTVFNFDYRCWKNKYLFIYLFYVERAIGLILFCINNSILNFFFYNCILNWKFKRTLLASVLWCIYTYTVVSYLIVLMFSTTQQINILWLLNFTRWISLQTENEYPLSLCLFHLCSSLSRAKNTS